MTPFASPLASPLACHSCLAAGHGGLALDSSENDAPEERSPCERVSSGFCFLVGFSRFSLAPSTLWFSHRCLGLLCERIPGPPGVLRDAIACVCCSRATWAPKRRPGFTIPQEWQQGRGQTFFRYTDQQRYRECQASEMSTRPPKLQVLIETLCLSIPTELHEQLSTGPVPMQNW